MLSSSISVMMQRSFSCFFAAEAALSFGLGGVNGVSTSTTRTTALPSSTFRTFSASHDLVADVDAEAAVEGSAEPPENASQKAPPSFLSSVWDAIAASIASCSLCARGVLGGLGYAGTAEGDGDELEVVDLAASAPPSLKNAGRSA